MSSTKTAADIVTITDKDKFSVSILDKSRYDALDDEMKSIFVSMRNAFLEVLPTNDLGTFDDLVLKYAENFGFISLQAFNNFYKIMNAKIESLESKINTLNKTVTTLNTSIAKLSLTETTETTD